MQKPSIPKGTRDFTPAEMVRRNYIFDTIRSIFTTYGYQPIETPSMENLSTLMGKYGEEGDKLLFKILNSGNFLDGISRNAITPDTYKELAPEIAEKGLRYDLTVPFARFVVQHQNEIPFPFKRYQIQPVWRADRPQKGRYREFFQCDVDVIGSTSLLYEAELVQIIDDLFTRLGIPVVIRLNNRKVLAGIAKVIGHPDKLTEITTAIDKMDKIGPEKVKEELEERGIPKDAVARLEPFLALEGNLESKLNFLDRHLLPSFEGFNGLNELKEVFGYLESLDLNSPVDFDLKLARGLNYYTGTIFEVKGTTTSIGSLCGGGRYDNLTGIFGLPGVSGVGISFGADRIYDVMLENGLFPEKISSTTRVLFIHFGPEEVSHSLKLLTRVRKAGIPAEIYPEAAKMKKQFDYANRQNIPWVALAGKEEIEQGTLTVKNMASGEQSRMTLEQFIRQAGD